MSWRRFQALLYGLSPESLFVLTNRKPKGKGNEEVTRTITDPVEAEQVVMQMLGPKKA
jgi:hypothetical protein